MSMSAHYALTTLDCVQPGCISEAAKGSEFCDAHRRGRLDRSTVPVPTAGLAETTTQEAPMALATCKIDGCSRPSAGKGGWCVGLCDVHVSEEGTRRQRVRHERRRSPGSVKPPPAAPAPKPAPREPVVPDQAAPATPTGIARITNLEALVADLEEQLTTARQELHAAATAYVNEIRDRYGIAA